MFEPPCDPPEFGMFLPKTIVRNVIDMVCAVHVVHPHPEPRTDAVLPTAIDPACERIDPSLPVKRDVVEPTTKPFLNFCGRRVGEEWLIVALVRIESIPRGLFYLTGNVRPLRRDAEDDFPNLCAGM